MALPDGRGAGLRRAALGRPGFVALACGLYLAAGLAAMWPAPEHFGSRFAARGHTVSGEADPGDHLQAVYHLWLVGHQLEHGHAPWRDPYTFQPESSPRVNFGGWPFGLPFWPLEAVFGTVTAWNLFLLLTYLGAGGFALLWLRELGLPRGPALVGGLAFALAPYRVAQSAGHFRGPISILLPLALFAFERSRRRGRWWLLLAAAALASIPFSDLHLGLGATGFFAVYALLRARDPWMLAGGAFATLAAAGTGLLVAGTGVPGSIGSGGRSLHEVAGYSANGLDFLTRHQRHGPESFVFLGWLTPLLALAGLVVLVRARRLHLAAALLVGAAVPIMLAFGTGFPLYSWLWHHFPPLRYPRVPERFMPVACLAIAALAAVAVARLGRAVPARLVTVCYVVAVLAVGADLRVEAYRTAEADPANRAYTALRSEPAGRLLEIPVMHPNVARGSAYFYYDMQAGRERPGGYSTVAPKRAAELALRLQSLNCGDWPPGTDGLLDRLGVRYLAFHASLFSGERGWFAWRGVAAHGWRPLARDRVVTTLVKGLPAGPNPLSEPRRTVVFCPQWHDRSPRYRHGAFWAHGAGELVVRLESEGPDRTTITADGTSRSVRVVEPSSLSVPLRRGGWHLVRVAVARADRNVRLVSIRATRG